MRVIGIDPDLDKSGVAVAIDGTLVELKALGFFDLLEFIRQQHQAGARFVVEDVEINKPTFVRQTKDGSRERQMQKISQNVGQVKGVARLIAQYLLRVGANYVAVRPLGGSAKTAKKDAAYFNRITGWKGQSNEDKRDAAMLALHGAPGWRDVKA